MRTATRDLIAKYKTQADAERAGYFRYTNEDVTGAISYANLRWNSAADERHPQPSQLWYNVNGRLLGVDYSIPMNKTNRSTPPNLWGVMPRRWTRFKHSHVHYVLTEPNGTMLYGQSVDAQDYTAAGGNLADPTAQPLLAMKKVMDVHEVEKVFTFPAQWDPEFWVVKNPLGAFSLMNPAVKPTREAGED